MGDSCFNSGMESITKAAGMSVDKKENRRKQKQKRKQAITLESTRFVCLVVPIKLRSSHRFSRVEALLRTPSPRSSST